VRRKRGFCATEVFHLWHREQSREQESPNYRRMMARRNTDVIRSEEHTSQHDALPICVRRKRGFCATEVFHLWHREQSREQESPNYRRMMARRNTDVIRAEAGLTELRGQGA